MHTRIVRFLMITALILAGAVNLPAQTFTDITTSSGLETVRGLRPVDWWVSGLLFIDLDGDGDLDCFLGSHDGSALAALNDGAGHFSAVTSGYSSSEIHVVYDINEDGKQDLAMTYSDGGGQWWVNHSTAGSLNFIAQSATVGNARQQSMADINKDGKVDWLIGVENQGIITELGNGTGTFTQSGQPLPIMATSDGTVPIPVDIDNDGDKDLVVEWGRYDYEAGRSRIYRNDGSGVFTDITTAAGLYQDNLAILAAGDVDQDGDMDLVCMENKQFPLSIFINDGTGHFTKKASAFTGAPTGGVTYASWGLGCLTDFDNDGIADLVIGGRNYLNVYRGTGGGNFTYMNGTWGIVNTAEASVDNAFTFGDIDKDGDLDLMGWKVIYPNRYYNVYRNDLPAKNWIRVRPVGLSGNKGAAGAKIRVFQPGTTTLLWYEEILTYCKQAQQSYGYYQNQTERHYGLNARASVDVEVEFYPSGTKVKKTAAVANKTWIISEDGTTNEYVDVEKGSGLTRKAGEMLLTASPNPCNTGTIVSYNVPLAARGGDRVRLSIYAPDGKLIAALVDRFVEPGMHQAVWNTGDAHPGAYIARLRVGTEIATKSILLLK